MSRLWGAPDSQPLFCPKETVLIKTASNKIKGALDICLTADGFFLGKIVVGSRAHPIGATLDEKHDSVAMVISAAEAFLYHLGLRNVIFENIPREL